MSNRTQEVDRFMGKLDHPLKEGIEQLRAAILGSNDQITEHIKWNAPSFRYAGEDRVTFRLYPEHRVQLVFHRGPKVKRDVVARAEAGRGARRRERRRKRGAVTGEPLPGPPASSWSSRPGGLPGGWAYRADPGATSTLSTRWPSMSTTSKEYPSHSKRSPTVGTRPRRAITIPPTVW